MKKRVILVSAASALMSVMFVQCGGSSSSPSNSNTTTQETSTSTTESNQNNAPIDPMQDKGVGPIKSVTLDDQINEEMAKEGEKIYSEKCTACHKPYEDYIGPAPVGILERRTPEWIMNMILNPDGMVKEDPVAKELLAKYNGTPMANQGLTEDEARKILEYYRTLKPQNK